LIGFASRKAGHAVLHLQLPVMLNWYEKWNAGFHEVTEMSGMVLLGHHFLENCPFRASLYHALESAVTSLFGGYKPNTMHYRGRSAEVSHYALYPSVTTEGEHKDRLRQIGTEQGYRGTNISFTSAQLRQEIRQYRLLLGKRIDGTGYLRLYMASALRKLSVSISSLRFGSQRRSASGSP
jgi:hypothetical protein